MSTLLSTICWTCQQTKATVLNDDVSMFCAQEPIQPQIAKEIAPSLFLHVILLVVFPLTLSLESVPIFHVF